MSNPFGRTKQCDACPWKVATAPACDIPSGYDAKKHAGLARCDGGFGSPIMACHESHPGRDYACVGWLVWALGDGNSIPTRLAVVDGLLNPDDLVLEGEQHPSLAAMLATAGRCR